MSPPGNPAPFPGDELLPDAGMVFDRTTTIDAPAAAIWPWLVQLGKARAGWYLPQSIERWLPRRRRARWHVEPQWQPLRVGDRVPDYGLRDEHFVVAVIAPERALVYSATRYGTRFTWALLLEPDEARTTVRLRFRGAIRSTGWRRRLIVGAADLLDAATTRPMLAGLARRVESGRTTSPP